MRLFHREDDHYSFVILRLYRVTFPYIPEAASFIIIADGYRHAYDDAARFIKDQAHIPEVPIGAFKVEEITDPKSVGAVQVGHTSIILLDKE